MILSAIPSAEAGPLQQVDNRVGEIQSINLYMMGSYSLTAEPSENGTQRKEVLLPKGWVCAAWSPRCQFGSAIWMDVGTWKTESLADTINLGGEVTAVVFVQNTGQYTPGTSDLEFSIIYQGAALASKVVTANLRSEGSIERIEVKMSINGTPSFQRGDTISLKIRCMIAMDGSRMYFGSPDAPSMLILRGDAIRINDVHGCQKTVFASFKEAMGVRWNSPAMMGKMTAYIDGIPILDVEPDVSPGDDGMEVTWKKGVRPGSHKIKVSLTYDGSSTWVMEKSVNIPEPGLDIMAFMPVFIVLLIVIIAGVAYKRTQED